jgi:hypothetical protein
LSTNSPQHRRLGFPPPPVKDLVPPLFLLHSWDRQGLIKLVLLQVLVPDARRSRAPPAGAPPDPLPLPGSLTGAFPSFLSSPPSSTHGEQKPLLDIPSF